MKGYGLDLQGRKTKLFTLTGLWALLLLVLSLEPKWFVSLVLRGPGLLSAAHAGVFVVMAFLLCLALRFQRSLFAWRMDNRGVFIAAFAACLFYGGLTEAAQVFAPSRTPDWMDFYCDAAGAGFGIALFFIYSQKVALARAFSFLLEKIPGFRKGMAFLE